MLDRSNRALYPFSEDLLQQLEAVALLFPDKSIDGALVRCAAARIRELEAEREWKPIETAPKDGTRILTWLDNHAAGAQPRVSRWRNDKWVEDDGAWFVYAPTHWTALHTPLSPKEETNV